MDLLVSNQSNGSLRIIRFKKQNNQLSIKVKDEVCIEGKENYIQHIKTINFQNKMYLVIGRKNGLLQLYESTYPKKKSFKLFKEWKNSNMNNQDSIISIGFINNQYLYSCSNDGKLIIRDLVNDDENQSYKVYIISYPVSSIKIKFLKKFRKFLISSAGKNNELKLYEINLSDQNDISVGSSDMRSTLNQTIRPLRRRETVLNLRTSSSSFSSSSSSSLFSNDRQVNTLLPFWISSSYYRDYVYKSTSFESISNWIISICFVTLDNEELIICGTQIGNLLIYNIMEESYPVKVMQLSQFAINNLQVFNNNKFLIFSDSMSKIGIIKLSNFKIVNFYDNLKIGPSISFKFIISEQQEVNRKCKEIPKFNPIYILCSNINMNVLIYKLYDDNTYDLVINLQMNSMVPSLSIICDNEYNLIDSLACDTFEEKQEQPITKRRKNNKLETIRIKQQHEHRMFDNLSNDNNMPDNNNYTFKRELNADNEDNETINDGLKSINLVN